MPFSHRSPIIGGSSETADSSALSLRRIVTQAHARLRAHDEARERFRKSTEVYITHKHRPQKFEGSTNRITHVRCWYLSEKGLFESDVFESKDVIEMIELGKHEIYTAGLDVAEDEKFDFWLLTKNGAKVKAEDFDTAYLKTEGDGAEYNNLGRLARCNPQEPRDIKPTYSNPPKPPRRPWSDEKPKRSQR